MDFKIGSAVVVQDHWGYTIVTMLASYDRGSDCYQMADCWPDGPYRGCMARWVKRLATPEEVAAYHLARGTAL
jgi:hypothetical protein